MSFRAGVGIAARLSDDWRLHLQGTTGQQSHMYDVIDTIGQSLSGTLNSRILKISIVAEKKMGKHFRLQAGIVLNSQRIQYTPGNGGDLLTTKMDQIYQQTNIIHAPYTISNTYGYRQSTKTWIGFQVGIFYNINFNKRE